MTQQSSKYTVDDVKFVRDTVGAGMLECKQALDKFDGDRLLAAGYLNYVGCAVARWRYEDGKRIDDREEWAIRMAHKYKQDHLTKPNQAKPS